MKGKVNTHLYNLYLLLVLFVVGCSNDPVKDGALDPSTNKK